jgi:ABC-type lipoprotein export system ATPase subunit
MAEASALKIEGLKFRYGAGEAPASAGGAGIGAGTGGRAWTVDVRALELSPGEQVLLTAGSGRGKSTLLQLIAGLLEPSAGTVWVRGQDVHALSGAKRDLFRGSHVGMIFQTFQLLPGFTAKENVLAALLFSKTPRKEHDARARALLGELGIERMDAPAEELSIGQQQRVAVARALVCGPDVVLADEPTASLDPETALVAMELIQEACRDRGAALLCVSHDPSMAERFGRRVALDELASAGGPTAAASGVQEGVR